MIGIILGIIIILFLFWRWIKYLEHCRNWEKFSNNLPGD
jgi:hypothetical protein